MDLVNHRRQAMTTIVARAAAFLVLFTIAMAARAQAPHENAVSASICDIAKAPPKYQGKLVKVRVQVWSGAHSVWLNEAATATNVRFREGCRWVRAQFPHGTRLWGSTAYATLTGRIAPAPILKNGLPLLQDGVPAVVLSVESESDIEDQQLHTGYLVAPKVYNPDRKRFEIPR